MATTLLEGNIACITGPPLYTHSRLDPVTIYHGDEVNFARLKYDFLRNIRIMLADRPLYEYENGQPLLHLARGPNPIFRDLKSIIDAHEQLIRSRNYRPKIEEVDAIKKESSTLTINLSKLRLEEFLGDERASLVISTVNYDDLSEEERGLAERFFEQGDKFKETMNTFRKNGIRRIRIDILSPEHVKILTEEGAIARVAVIDSWDDNSKVVLDYNDLNDPYMSIIGALKETK